MMMRRGQNINSSLVSNNSSGSGSGLLTPVRNQGGSTGSSSLGLQRQPTLSAANLNNKYNFDYGGGATTVTYNQG